MVVLLAPHTTTSHHSLLPSPSLSLAFSLSFSLASPLCDRNHSAGQTSQCPFYSWLVTGPCRRVSLISKPTFIKERRRKEEKKKGNSEPFDRNLHPQQSLKPESWGDLLRFHFIWSFFFLPLSQNMWVIRAETFPSHTQAGCLSTEVLLCLCLYADEIH